MPSIRRDPLTHRLVTVAPERASRPHDFDRHDTRAVATDVFTEGNEHLTPPEVYADRPEDAPADGPGWHVRVVPNRFPAVDLESSLPEGFVCKPGFGCYPSQDPPPSESHLFESFPGFGSHEVVVECPDANLSFHELPVEQLARVFSAYRHRVAAYRHDERFRYVQVFKNVGHKAGASVLHPHSQIVALPFAPHRISLKQGIAEEFQRTTGRDLYRAVAREELASSKRVLAQEGPWLAFCPYASAFAYEVMILPLPDMPDSAHPFTDLADFTDDCLLQLARLLHRVLHALSETGHLEEFNLALYQSAWPEGGVSSAYRMRWHLSILPRVSGIAGLELSTGMFINTTPPEVAARELRDVLGTAVNSASAPVN